LFVGRFGWQEIKIFSKEKPYPPLAVATYAIGQLSEFLLTKKPFTLVGAPMKTKEEAWINKLNLKESQHLGG